MNRQVYIQEHCSNKKVHFLNILDNKFKFVQGCGFIGCQIQNICKRDQIYFQGKFQNGDFVGVQLQKFDEKVWKKVNGQKIRVGVQNEIRIGRTVLKIRKILKYSQVVQQERKKRLTLPKCEDSSAQCRFCLEKCCQQSNPLVVPCRCTGSSGGVHQRCLSYWIFSNHGSFNKEMRTFAFRVERRECEICKYGLQGFIESRMLSVMVKDEADYLLLQKINEDEVNDFMICKYRNGENKIRIGKSKSCQIGFVDGSMSNQNSVLSYDDGEIWIEDRDSKFGTYVGCGDSLLGLNSSYCVKDLYLTISKKVIKKRK